MIRIGFYRCHGFAKRNECSNLVEPGLWTGCNLRGKVRRKRRRVNVNFTLLWIPLLAAYGRSPREPYNLLAGVLHFRSPAVISWIQVGTHFCAIVLVAPSRLTAVRSKAANDAPSSGFETGLMDLSLLWSNLHYWATRTKAEHLIRAPKGRIFKRSCLHNQ